MGRDFEIGTKEVSERWLKASRALKKEDQVYGQRLAKIVKERQQIKILTYRPSRNVICSIL